MTSSTLFGAPVWFSSVECQRWIRVLTRNWFAMMGRAPGALEDDLNDLSGVFGTGVSARTLKSRVYALPPVDPETVELPSEVVVILDGCALITPEGRLLLDVLIQLQRTGRHEIDGETQIGALAAATSLRLRWQATWMHKQFQSSISPAVLGAAVFLLLNGCVGAERALVLSKDEAFDGRLGAVVQPLIADFSQALGGDQPSQTPGLRGYWPFSQVSRLMGRDVARDRADEGARMYIRPGRQDHLTRELSSRLDRLQDPARTYVAVKGLVGAYHQRRGALAALNQMFEDPTFTRRMTDALTGRVGAP